MDPLRGDASAATAAPAPQKSFLDGVLPQALQDGPVGAVVAGGAGLAALSLGLGLFRSGSRLAVSGLRRHLTTTLEVTSKDPAYPWVLHWLKEAKGRSNASFKHVSAATIVGDEAGGASFDLVPSPGKHVVRYGGSWLLVERAREYGTVNTSSGTPWEKLTLTAFASPATAAGGLFRDLPRQVITYSFHSHDVVVLRLPPARQPHAHSPPALHLNLLDKLPSREGQVGPTECRL